MSVLVVLSLFSKLRKSDKKRGLPSILSLFRNEFNKFNNTKVRMIHSDYHITLKIIKNRIFIVKTLKVCHLLRNVKYVIT